MKGTVTCYAWTRGEEWEALCTDFDLAARGSSFEEARQEIVDAIETYISYVAELPEPDRTTLMGRKAPLSVRLRLELSYRAFTLLNLLRIRFACFYSFRSPVVLNPAT